MSKNSLFQYIDNNSERFNDFGDLMFDNPETCYKEFKTFAYQKEFMEKEGFSITTPVAGIETAFIAEYGEGKPVVAIVSSIDGLPNLSQVPDIFEEKPIVEGGNGHGCGHHLLGVGCMETACALKEAIASGELKGTIRYYACPAEEGGGGKVFMSQAGAFDGIDAIFTWHPMPSNSHAGGSLSCVTVRYNFEGIAAHAAAEPWGGRSALDAVELMNAGVQYLREHILPTSRIHYAVTNSGGDAPNIVQAHAEVLYSIRTIDDDSLADVFARVNKIAQGAALMTETTLVEPKIISAYSEKLVNKVLDDLIVKQFDEVPVPEYTEEELAYLEKYKNLGGKPNSKEVIDRGLFNMSDLPPLASTDMSDVSWMAPTCNIGIACYAIGTKGHSWPQTAQGKSSVAHKGMHRAAKLMAGGAYEIFTNPELVKAAHEDQERLVAGRTYKSLMPLVDNPAEFYG